MALDRRAFVKLAACAPALALPGCTDPERYTDEDAARLEAQRRLERERSGRGPYGPRRYRGYRGLAELPWFELDAQGRLRCVAEGLPPALDVHAHLGMSLLLAPEIDLQASTPRVHHILDCDAEDPGCPLDLDVYINANFRPEDLRALRRGAISQMLWGSAAAATHTIPNLLEEMRATRVERALVLPIAFGLPFGDDLSERWLRAISEAGAGGRLLPGASVHPRDPEAVVRLRSYAARGARAVKLHPAMQRFFPDAPEAEPIYEACAELGLPVVFHGGRAGIEPTYTHQFTLMRHYEGALRNFPEVQFVIGHAGARDVADAIPLAQRYPNAWLGIHGQGVTTLDEMIRRLGAGRLLFGSDWPFYHLAATLAKVLIVTEGRPDARYAILRGNADRLLGVG
ncbi:MAG: amidohydrolase family protein [Myxococcales bacterium]|nr:amidohydrolase family protein [Myxococcales bacterium]